MWTILAQGSTERTAARSTLLSHQLAVTRPRQDMAPVRVTDPQLRRRDRAISTDLRSGTRRDEVHMRRRLLVKAIVVTWVNLESLPAGGNYLPYALPFQSLSLKMLICEQRSPRYSRQTLYCQIHILPIRKSWRMRSRQTRS